MTTKKFRERLIAAVTFLGGLYFFIEFVLPAEIPLGEGREPFKFGKYHSEIINGVVLVGAMAIALGLINLLQVHGRNIIRGQKAWGNSLALLLGLFITLGVESGDFLASEQRATELKSLSDLISYVRKLEGDETSVNALTSENLALISTTLAKIEEYSTTERSYLKTTNDALSSKFQAARESIAEAERLRSRSDSKQALSGIVNALKELFNVATEVSNEAYANSLPKKLSGFLFRGFLAPLGAAMFSLLAFYIASAAYRTFRVRSVEASLMMFAALIVIAGQIPHGPIYISGDLPLVRLWFINNISTPAFRTIYFGAAIAGIAMAFRMWFSLEKSPLSAADDTEETSDR